MGFAARVFEYRRNKKERKDRAKELETPVSSETANLTWQERWERAKKKGTLLSAAEVAKRTMTKKPSQQQIVRESENEEQRQRDKELKRLEGGAEDAAKAMNLFGRSIEGAVFKRPIQAVVMFSLAMVAATKAIEKLSSMQLEKSRELQAYSGDFARLFQQMERQKRLLDSRMAGATRGSGDTLGKSIMELRETLQPFAQAARTATNVAAAGATEGINLLVLALQGMPHLQALLKIAELAERWFGNDKAPQENQWMDWFRRTSANGFPGMEQPRNQRPRAPQGPQAGQGGP